MKMNFLSLIFLLASSISIAGEIPERWKLNVDSSGEVSSRYDYQAEDERERLQARVRLSFEVDLNNKFKLIAVSSTGSSFASDWGTVKDLDNSNLVTPDFALRRLFVEYENEGTKVQVGSIPTIKNRRSALGLDQSGWIDGVRVEKSFSGGDGIFEIVAGSIDDLDEANVFKRERNLNFFEVEISKNLFNNLVGEVKFEHFQGDNFFQGVIKNQLTLAGDKVIEYVAEYLQSFEDKDARGVVVSAETDLLKLLLDKYDGRLSLDVSFQYVDEALGLRAELNDDFFVSGKLIRVGLKGRISKNQKATWFANGYFGDDTRVNIGFRLRWK